MDRNQLQTDNKVKEKEIISATGAFYDELRRRIRRGKRETDSKELVDIFLYRVAEERDYFKGKICLDAGCGHGRVTHNLASLDVTTVFGIDIGEYSVHLTKNYTGDFSNVIVVRASVLDLPFPDNYFDFVHCSGVLHHTTNPKRGFKELARVTKKGGTLFIAVYGRGVVPIHDFLFEAF